ncbi:hypothetical protein [Pantoea sp. App145]|uniref:hypothetical protein n=1 Tax=Pantoea sp. App145 TaxID=3071567 RepID=UPI003A80B9DD
MMNVNSISGTSHGNQNTASHRPAIPGIYSANGKIEKTGTDINGTTTSNRGDIILTDCRAGKPEKPVAIKQYNGKVILKEDCQIQGNVEIDLGHAPIEKTTIKGDLINHNGSCTLHHSHVENINSSRGTVALTRSNADSIIAHNGNVSLEDHSAVKYDVTLSNGSISIDSSTIGGTLELNSNKMEIGKHSSVHHVKMNCVNDISVVALSSFRLTRNVKIVINGIQRFPTTQPGDAAEKLTQILTLKDGAELHRVEFNGKNLIMNLEGSAHYTGGEMAGLTINRVT